MSIRYAATQWCFPGYGVYAVRNAASVGFEGLQIELGCEKDGYYMAQKRIQQAYLEDAEKYAVEFPSIVLNDLDFNGYVKGPGRPEYQIAMQSIDMVIQVARDMDIGMIMLPHYQDNAITDDYTMSNAIRILRETCKKAQIWGLTVGVETCLNNEQHRQLFDSIDMPNVCLYYDSQNYKFESHLSQKEIIEGSYRYIKDQLHVKDGFGHRSDGGEQSNALMGKGDSDFMATIAYLKKMHYEGWLVVENYYYSKNLRSLRADCFETMEEDLNFLKSLFADET